MKLAKPRIDIGLYTNRRDEMLAFWRDEVGLPYEEMLPIGGGVQQHRFDLAGSVLKINHSREPLPDEPRAGYRELTIARAGQSNERALVDPDGNRVKLVPEGHAAIARIRLTLGVRDLTAFRAFYAGALQLEPLTDTTFRCGDSLLSIAADAGAKPVGRMTGPGYRYITIQVFDVNAEHAGILARGGSEGRAPLTLGKVARISFVRDPDGNWIEISQRASLTGPVPE
jgi:catechol 2,3-dioxygenase-like lactoylglutathione lyase family enzyme